MPACPIQSRSTTTGPVTEFILRKARKADLAHVYPIGALTTGSDGKRIAEYWDLREAGAVALSDDGKPVMDAALMRRAMEYTYSLDLPVIQHCEDKDLSTGGLMNEGYWSTQLGLPGIPSISEEVMVGRDILIAEYTCTRIHIAHVSTAGSVRLIRDAQKRGVQVTAEAAPRHFTLTDQAVAGYNTNYKVSPPLRTGRRKSRQGGTRRRDNRGHRLRPCPACPHGQGSRV